MKKLLLILFCLPFIGFGQQTYVPDDNFEQALINFGYDNILDDSVLTSNINTITSLDISFSNISDLTGIEDFIAITSLSCWNNQLTSLDLSQNTALIALSCYNNQLITVDVSQNNLVYLDCSNNQITSLDVSQSNSLTEFYCINNQLTSLDVSQNTAIIWFRCNDNLLTSLDLSTITDLLVLDCSNNQLTSLDLRNGNNQNLWNTQNLSTLNNPNLCCISVDDTIYSAATWFDIDSWTFYRTDCSLEPIGCTNPLALNFDSTATCDNGSCIIPSTYVPDDNFENYLENNGMGNGIANDDSVYTANINTVDTLNVYSKNIFDLTGIEAFTALTWLQCSYNELTSLDFSQNIALEVLYCYNNQLTSLDVSQNTALANLRCNNNQLTSLDVSNNTALTNLHCNNNQLTSLDVSNNTTLTELYCSYNQIECLDISNNLVLTNLDCNNNLLEQLNTRNGNFNFMSVNALNNNLTCVEVDNIGTATNNWSFDSFATLTTNCNYANSCNMTYGCTDALACNYDAAANTDDGSCNYPTTSTDNQVACDTYTWNGINYTSSGTYTYTTTNSVGCDSVATLDLTVNYSTTSTDNQVACDTYTWIDGVTYTASNNTATFTSTNAAGCTEINSLYLTIIYSTSSYDTLSVGASIVWNGMPLNVSGDYSVTLINSVGCDSIVNLNLTVTTTGISDIANSKSNLVKITDVLGKETPYRRNTPLFYIYDDGTVEKRIVIE